MPGLPKDAVRLVPRIRALLADHPDGLTANQIAEQVGSTFLSVDWLLKNLPESFARVHRGRDPYEELTHHRHPWKTSGPRGFSARWVLR